MEGEAIIGKQIFCFEGCTDQTQALYSKGVPFSSAGLTLSGAKNTSGTNVLPRIQMFCTYLRRNKVMVKHEIFVKPGWDLYLLGVSALVTYNRATIQKSHL